jgi:hypothetical protein
MNLRESAGFVLWDEDHPLLFLDFGLVARL